MEIQTNVRIDRDRRVLSIEWYSDEQSCKAVLSKEDPTKYVYSSELHGDEKEVESERLMTLADCVLAAHVHLGAIPPHNFEEIPCPNKF